MYQYSCIRPQIAFGYMQKTSLSWKNDIVILPVKCKDSVAQLVSTLNWSQLNSNPEIRGSNPTLGYFFKIYFNCLTLILNVWNQQHDHCFNKFQFYIIKCYNSLISIFDLINIRIYRAPFFYIQSFRLNMLGWTQGASLFICIFACPGTTA